MQRPEAPEGGPGQIQVEPGEDQLPSDEVAGQESDHTPEHGGDHAGADHAIHIGDAGSALDQGIPGLVEYFGDQGEDADEGSEHEEMAMEFHGAVLGLGGEGKPHQPAYGQEPDEQRIAVRRPPRFSSGLRLANVVSICPVCCLPPYLAALLRRQTPSGPTGSGSSLPIASELWRGHAGGILI